MTELGTYPPSTSDRPPAQPPDQPTGGGNDSFTDKYLGSVGAFQPPPEMPRTVEPGHAKAKPEGGHTPLINSAFGTGAGGGAVHSGPEHGDGGDPCILVPTDTAPQFVPVLDGRAPGQSTSDFTSGYLGDAQPAPLLAAAIPVADATASPSLPDVPAPPTSPVMVAAAPVVMELDVQNQVVPTPDAPQAVVRPDLAVQPAVGPDLAIPPVVRPVDPNAPSFAELVRPATVFEQRIAEGKPFTIGLAIADVQAVWSTDASVARLNVDPAAVHTIRDPATRDVVGYRVHEGDTTYRLNRDGTVVTLEADPPATKAAGDTAVPTSRPPVAPTSVAVAPGPAGPGPVQLPGPPGEPVRVPGFGPDSFRQPFVEPGTPEPATMPEAPGTPGPAVAPAAESTLGRILGVLGEVVGGAAVVLATGALISSDTHVENTAERLRVTVVDLLQYYVEQENNTLRDAVDRGDYSLIEEKAPKLWDSVMRIANFNPDLAISLFKIAYGITMEALVADLVSADPLLNEYLEHVGGPNREDFRGKGLLGGLKVDVTTRSDVDAHKDPIKRPGYGENSTVLPYEPPW